MNKELVKFRLEHIKKAVLSMERSSKHPKTSAHYKGIIYDVDEILKELNNGQ